MTDEDRTELRNAAESLDDASERATDDETADRLVSFADRVRTMADADRGPDHGGLARLEHGLKEVQGDLNDEGAEAVDEALDRVRAYRATVEGV